MVMSTEGNGWLGACGAILVAAPFATAVLGAKGVMYVGKILKKRYDNVCKEWTERSKPDYIIEDIPHFLTTQVDYIAFASSNLAPADTTPPDVAERFVHLRRTLEDPEVARRVQAETERELLSYRLKLEIEAARGVLPAEKIAAAEAALDGSTETIQSTLTMLETAWKEVQDAQAQRDRQVFQVRQLLNILTTQLGTVDALLRETGKAQNLVYVNQRRAIEMQIRNVEAQLSTGRAQALATAQAAQKALHELTESVSADAFRAWEKTRTQIISQQGALDTLEKMLTEAVALKLVDAQKAETIKRRITTAQREAEDLLQMASTSPTVQRKLILLTDRVEQLKKEVFRVTQGGQQQYIAEAVATTLEELGFQSQTGGQLATEQITDGLRIVATRSGDTPNFARDDKLVSFTISQDGAVSYDFSGYVGDSCVSEAERVFAALRAKGIFILDSDTLDSLQRIPAENITLDTLRQTSLPHIVQNKPQAELAVRLRQVLERMKFSNIQESVVGGTIDLEAFNGPLGYRVVLPPDGSAQVFKNRADVSNDASDPIATEAQREVEVLEEIAPASVEGKAKDTDVMRQQINIRKQQELQY
jgi:hypothetical protein